MLVFLVMRMLSVHKTGCRNFLLIYLFFFYFVAVFQGILLYTNMVSLLAIRDLVIFTITFTLFPLLFHRATRYYLIVLGFIFWAASLINILYFFIFKQEMSMSIFFIIFETNQAEGFEFIRNYFRMWMLPFIVFYTLVPLYILSKIQAQEFSRNFIYFWGLIILLCNISPFYKKSSGWNLNSVNSGFTRLINKYAVIPPFQFLSGYFLYKKEVEKINEIVGRLSKNKVTDNKNALKDRTKNQTYVLVIGESTNSKRMSLYGYQRNTSPLLNTIKDELFIFNDITTPRPATIDALFQVLTFADQKHLNSFNPNIMTIMHSVGFKIFWITNQQTLSDTNSLLTAFSRLADKQIYLNQNRRQSSISYDSKILAPLTEVLKDSSDKKFIIVHLLGTHGQYRFRYPKEFAVFNNDFMVTKYALHSKNNIALYNHYDNAVLYNDYIVYNIIKFFKKSNQYGAMLYFSDHGEEVFDSKNFYGRNESIPTKSMYTVPFIVWGEHSWRKNRNADSWHQYLNRPYSTENMIHGWCDLIKLNIDNCDPTRSIFNKKFVAQQRLIGDPSNINRLKLYEELKS